MDRIAEIQARLAAINTEMDNAEGEAFTALETEARSLMEEMKGLQATIEARKQLRSQIAAGAGNPVAVACGLATLKMIQEEGFYDRLAAQTTKLITGLKAAADAEGVTFSAQSIGGMFGLYFLPQLPTGFADVMKSDGKRFNLFFHEMLNRGVYLAPSLYEAGFVSSAHDDVAIEETIAAAKEAFAVVAKAQ